MAKILIAYGTNSNGTFFASQHIANRLAHKNHTVDLKEVRQITVNELDTYELILLGTNTWFYNGKQGQPHIWYFPFEEELRKTDKKSRNFAVYALGDSSYIEFCHSADYLENMIRETGGKLICDALRIDGYYFEEKKNNQLLDAWVDNLII